MPRSADTAKTGVRHRRYDPDGVPVLSNVRILSPTGHAVNEAGFSADSSSPVFTSDFETHNFYSDQNYRYGLNSHADN